VAADGSSPTLVAPPAPRVHAELRKLGRRHSRKRIARLMHQAGRRARRSWRIRTITDPAAPAAPPKRPVNVQSASWLTAQLARFNRKKPQTALSAGPFDRAGRHGARRLKRHSGRAVPYSREGGSHRSLRHPSPGLATRTDVSHRYH
jgi:transposase InsO family protein